MLTRPPAPASCATAAVPARIAVVTVNWNGWRLSRECIAALRTSKGVDWHLYLVDNASTDDSREHLRDLGDDVTVLLSDVNGGWTGGNNLAIRHALDDGFDYVFVLNNDALVEPDTMRELLRFVREHDGRPIVGPLHFDHDGRSLEFIGAQIDPRSGLPMITTARNVAVDTLPAAFATAFTKGAGIFATRAHFERLGLFDDKFYLNYDDTDWCFRAREAGFDLLMVSAARIIHGGSGSIGGGYSPLNVYFLARNELLFAERHCAWSQRPRQLVEFLRNANRLTGKRSISSRALALLFSRQRVARAWRAGVRDYLLRRFGDCPPVIRQMSADHGRP